MRWQLSVAVAIVAWGMFFGLTWLLDQTGRNWGWWFFVMPPALGFAMGLARRGLPAAPLAGAATIVTAYVLFMASLGVWATQCWDCSSGGSEWGRGLGFMAAGYIFGFIVVATLIAIGLGVIVTRYLPGARQASNGAAT
jgi:hypothetical protein